MAEKYSVSLERIINEFDLETVYLPQDAKNIKISSMEVNRPGLLLSGYLEYFDCNRIQVAGKGEMNYIYSLEPDEMKEKIRAFFSKKPITFIVSRDLEISDFIIEMGKEYLVPILRTSSATSEFMAALIAFLNVELAPRITQHGVLVEVYGEGILILGESGVGKSEAAIELIKRGHRLIADDVVEIKRVSNRSLVGQPPENIRHFIEVRGIGMINARRIFGMGAVKQSEKINLVITIEPWDTNKTYNRLGLEDEYYEILGIKVPCLTIPIKPGRNLAMIMEVAAMDNRQKKMGYNGAKELLEQLGMDPNEN